MKYLPTIILQRIGVAARAAAAGRTVIFARQGSDKFCWLTPGNLPNVIFSADTRAAYAQTEKLVRARYDEMVAELKQAAPEQLSS